MDRRRFIAAGFLLTPLAAALSACGKDEGWPEGMQADQVGSRYLRASATW